MIAALYGEERWLWAVTLALLAALGGLVVHWVVGGALRRAAKPHSIILHSTLTAVRAAAGFALPLLAMQLVWQAVPDDLPNIGGVRHINAVLLIGAVTWVVMRVVTGIADGVMARNPVDIADNLHARRVATQARVLSRSAQTIIIIAGTAMALLTFPGARQVGASLLASAGVLGIIAGFAARPVFSNLVAGLQIAIAQPIRIGDVLIVKGEWGRVEEITGSYVVMRIWDDRRLITPLNWFIENPFENWTRTTSALTGAVLLHLDYLTPLDAFREHARKVLETAPEWDQRVFVVQVVDASERAMQVRTLVSASDAGRLFDLRCRMREEMITFLSREHPYALPRQRQINEQTQEDTASLL